jgi:SAM-dependent methyltransferase
VRSVISTHRFSSRAANYARYRPGYPKAALEHLRRQCGLVPGSVVADIGSGTGLLSRQLLDLGCTVFAVEPNREMREAGETLLGDRANFTSLAAAAEATSLPDCSVDLVAAGQAFHWFDRAQARAEFRRVLKPNGWIALLWNYRRLDTTAFLRGYEALLRKYCPDYAEILDRDLHRRQVEEFFAGKVSLATFDNPQDFDWSGLEGRHLSQSYVPLEGPRFGPMMRELRELFDATQLGGRVVFEHETRLYCGQPPTSPRPSPP